jgi:O-antigen/teichoic acid export membrane protein
MVAVFIACFALSIPCAIVQKVQLGLQRGFLSSLWQVIGSILGLAGVVVAIMLRAGLEWLVLAYVGAPLAAALCNSLLFFGRSEPDIAPRFSGASSAVIRQIAHIGFYYFVLQIAATITISADNVVIAQELGAAAVVQYAVSERMFSTVAMVLAMAQAPLWPAYGEALSRSDFSWVKKTLTRSLRLAIGYSTVSSLILFLSGPALIRLWTGSVIQPTMLLLLGLALWKVVEACANALLYFLNGARVVGMQAVVGVATAILTLSLKILLIPRIGVAGAVWGTLIVYVVIALPAYYLVTIRYLRTRFGDKCCLGLLRLSGVKSSLH